MQNILIYYVGSGLCFFLGIFLIICATLLSASKHWISKYQFVLVVLGIFAIAISSTPLPGWWYIIMLVVVALWQTYLIFLQTPYSIVTFKLPPKRFLAIAVAMTFFIAGLCEWPYHRVPKLEKPASLLILADSITAGTGTSDKTVKWPSKLSQKLQIEIDNRSLPGARCLTALKQLNASPVASQLAILEIGGNDLLGSTSEQKFESDLRALLSELKKHDLKIVMYELPLPPLRNRYGQIQRSLAREFTVTLIPKWYLLDVTCREENTIDSIHLTQAGHDYFAANIAKLFQ